MNKIAIRPRAIVEARFKLSKRQNDIVDILLTKINRDTRRYEINVKDYMNLFDLQNQSTIYREMKIAVKKFKNQYIYIKDVENDIEITYAWFSRIEYRNQEGRIILDLHEDLVDLFDHIKNYIRYDIKYPVNLDSIYSKRIYYYLKMFEKTGERYDKVDDLKIKLECPKGYKGYYDFKKHILIPAHEEINKKTDLHFNFEEIKQGRGVGVIRFIIENKNSRASKEREVKKTKQKTLNFTDYPQRAYDYDSLEKQLLGWDEE